MELEVVADSKCETGFSASIQDYDTDLGMCVDKNYISYADKISPDMVCATTPFGKERGDTCQGDSGGPFSVRNSLGHHELVGVTSWGDGCAEVSEENSHS